LLGLHAHRKVSLTSNTFELHHGHGCVIFPQKIYSRSKYCLFPYLLHCIAASSCGASMNQSIDAHIISQVLHIKKYRHAISKNKFRWRHSARTKYHLLDFTTSHLWSISDTFIQPKGILSDTVHDEIGRWTKHKIHVGLISFPVTFSWVFIAVFHNP